MKRNKIIPLIAAALLCTSLCGCGDIHINGNVKIAYTRNYSTTEEAFLQKIRNKGIDDFTIYDSKDLTIEILEDRVGKGTIIERCFGIVLDDEGNGELLNDNGYIKYSHIKKGTIVMSYFVYNPENNYFDDIMERYDYVVGKGSELAI